MRLAKPVVVSPSAERRFWDKVTKTDGCWLWSSNTGKGYGVFDLGSENWVQAHRVAYTLLRGPLTPTLELDHLCHNRRCVNPDHLEEVTHSVNMRRAVRSRVGPYRGTHCRRGHAFTPDNLLSNGPGRRRCRQCNKDVNRRRRQEKTALLTQGGCA